MNADPQSAESIRPSDPLMILAGIRQFGLAADGSDLRDLEAALLAERQAREAAETASIRSTEMMIESGNAMTEAEDRAEAAEASLAKAGAKIAELEAALRPFARAADIHHSGFSDEAYAKPVVTVGQLRRSRSVPSNIAKERDDDV